MKIKTLKILVIIGLSITPIYSFSQFAQRFGVEGIVPFGKWSKDIYVAGVGIDYTLDYFLNDKSSLGLNTGINYLFTDKQVRDNSEKYLALMYPVLLQYNYFFKEGYEKGGIFGQVQGGINIYTINSKFAGVKQNSTETDPAFSVGIGFQDEKWHRYVLRYHIILNNPRQYNYIGFQFVF